MTRFQNISKIKSQNGLLIVILILLASSLVFLNLINYASAFEPTFATDKTWQSIGPSPINTQGTWGYNSGRVNAIAFDPAHQDTIYLGAAGGGIWKSTNRGLTWTALTDNQPSLATGSIAIDPSGVVYVGTGDPTFGVSSHYGAGILRSDNGGQTWTQLGSTTFGRSTFTKVAVNPTQPNIVLAATAYGATNSMTGQDRFVAPGSQLGVYRSADSGYSWTLVLSSGNILSPTGLPAFASDLLIDPSNPQVVYASIDDQFGHSGNTGGIYKSSDGGITFTPLSKPPDWPSSFGRIKLGISTQPQNTLFAVIEVLGGSKLFTSTTGGNSWTDTSSILPTNFCLGHCNSLMYIAPDPTNANILYLGGYDLYRLTYDTATSTWTDVDLGGYNPKVIHPDQHAFAFDPISHSSIVIGNDGGVWSSTSADTCSPNLCWTNLNNGLVITEFNSVASSTDSDRIIGGTQDNGTPKYVDPSQPWIQIADGDGGWTGIDPSLNSQTMYHTFVQLPPWRSDDNGWHWSPISPCQNSCPSSEPFPPMAIDPQNPSILYLGTSKLYKTTDKGGPLGTSDPWTHWSSQFERSASDNIGGYFQGFSAVSVAPSNDNYVYLGTPIGKFYASTDGANTFTELDTGLPTTPYPGKYLTKIAVDTLIPQKVYATFSGFGGKHVFVSPDNGNIWSDISSNLPDVPVNTIIEKNGYIFIGTDIGPYFSNDDGASWSPLGHGFPNVPIFDLILTNSNHLLAATYGRGVWDLSLVHISVTTKITRSACVDDPNFPPICPDFTNKVVSPSTLVYDTVRISSSSIPQGSITYHSFGTVDCTGTPADQTVQINTDGTVPPSSPITAMPLTNEIAYISYQIFYYNPLGNLVLVGSCEPVAISDNIDVDGDGIQNNIDTQPLIPSNDFSDHPTGGTTTGNIVDLGNQRLTITDVPNPDGVEIKADPSGGPISAKIDVCGPSGIIYASPGSDIIVSCHTVTTQVIDGQAKIDYYTLGPFTESDLVETGSDILRASATIGAGSTLTFDPVTFSFKTPSSNTESVSVTIMGNTISINPGLSVLGLTITPPPNVLVNTDPNLCTSSHPSISTATTTGGVAPVGITNNAPSTFTLGTSTVTWTATDSLTPTHQMVSEDQQVTVVDGQSPAITPPADKTVVANNAGGWTGSIGTPTASDNCPGVTYSNNAPSIFPIGTTTVTWTATDGAGHKSTSTQKITVNPIPVSINIKGPDGTNTINIKNGGIATVYLFGSSSFNVNNVNQNSLRFGGHTPQPSIHTVITNVNGDSYSDMLSQYSTSKLGFTTSDTKGCLAGKLLVSGIPFQGCGPVKIISK